MIIDNLTELARSRTVPPSASEEGESGIRTALVLVMETRKKLQGEEHPDTLTSMANLAATYWRWKEAEKMGVSVLEMNRRVLGEEHSLTLSSLANLASTYRDQGQWMEAEKM